MNGYLLDTHVLLWWLSGARVSATARKVLVERPKPVHFSAAAAWEMAIKKSLGRLEFPGNLEEVLAEEEIEVLPVSLPHALAVADLPLHHHDPFDRMQVAQAQLEGLVLVARDKMILEYSVESLKA